MGSVENLVWREGSPRSGRRGEALERNLSIVEGESSRYEAAGVNRSPMEMIDDMKVIIHETDKSYRAGRVAKIYARAVKGERAAGEVLSDTVTDFSKIIKGARKEEIVVKGMSGRASFMSKWIDNLDEGVESSASFVKGTANQIKTGRHFIEGTEDGIKRVVGNRRMKELAFETKVEGGGKNLLADMRIKFTDGTELVSEVKAEATADAVFDSLMSNKGLERLKQVTEGATEVTRRPALVTKAGITQDALLEVAKARGASAEVLGFLKRLPVADVL